MACAAWNSSKLSWLTMPELKSILPYENAERTCHFFGSIRRRRCPFQFVVDHLCGRPTWVIKVSKFHHGTPFHRPRKGRKQPRCRRRTQRNCRRTRYCHHRTEHPPPGPARRTPTRRAVRLARAEVHEYGRRMGREPSKLAGTASKRLGLSVHPTFSGALAWPYFYPWPQRSSGLVEEAFEELGRRWIPLLQHFDQCGVDLAYKYTWRRPPRRCHL